MSFYKSLWEHQSHKLMHCSCASSMGQGKKNSHIEHSKTLTSKPNRTTLNMKTGK